MRQWLEKHSDYTVAIRRAADGTANIVDGFVEADHVGTGIFLAQRGAFEAAKPFAECFGPPSQYRSALPSGNFYGFFETLREDGIYLSEDVSFCRRARMGGCEVWALLTRLSCTTERRRYRDNTCGRCDYAARSGR